MKHFKEREFKCPCCGQIKLAEEFKEKIDMARDIAGIPFIITSGYRCPKHNKEVGGKSDSAHLKGFAADVKATDSYTRYKIVTAALTAGFTRIGVAKNFIHLDCDPEKPQEVMWVY